MEGERSATTQLLSSEGPFDDSYDWREEEN